MPGRYSFAFPIHWPNPVSGAGISGVTQEKRSARRWEEGKSNRAWDLPIELPVKAFHNKDPVAGTAYSAMTGDMCSEVIPLR